MKEMSFRELARRIHPDLNPHIKDAGDKMLQAARVKNEPHELWKLAMRWGVSDIHRPQPRHTRQPEPVSNWRPATPKPRPAPVVEQEAPIATPVRMVPIIGDMVRVRTKDNIVVRVTKTTAKRVHFYHEGKSQYVLMTSVEIVPQR